MKQQWTRLTDVTARVPTTLVVFGATGDLMDRKIGPALAYLEQAGALPNQFEVIGVARRPLGSDAFRSRVRVSIRDRLEAGSVEPPDHFFARFSYHQGQFDDLSLYQSLAHQLGRLPGPGGSAVRARKNALIYLAVPPELVPGIVHQLAGTGFARRNSGRDGWTRLVLEKPFGRDLASSEALDRLLGELFGEEQLYRIDHYLGKDVLANILNFRFANRLFEPSWHAGTIERITVRLLETIGVETRGAFYDGVGALRDVGQNHLLQMLALATMDSPRSLGAADIRYARASLLGTVATPTEDDVRTGSFRAQYQGYRSIPDVRPDSNTETYFRLRLALTGQRWTGVPVWFEAGKRLGTVQKTIVVTFRHPEPCLCPPSGHVRNSVEFRLQPDPAIRVHFWAKPAGLGSQLEPQTLTFSLAEGRGRIQYVTEYAQLLLDAIAGDQTSFVATEELREMWRVTDPFVLGWQADVVPLTAYQSNNDTIRYVAAAQLEGKRLATARKS